LENGLDTVMHAWKGALKLDGSKYVYPCMGLIATIIARSGCSRALWTSFHFVDLLVTSMRLYRKEKDIQCSGCSILCVLLITEDHSKSFLIVDSFIPSFLLSSNTKHLSELQTTENFCLAKQLKDKGAFETTVLAMEHFPGDLGLQENAALFFLSLARVSD
jgi:hypothetical protein